MLFAHTADWHIGLGRNTIPNALERQTKAICSVYDKALSLGARTVVVAGDIFDRKDISPREMQAFWEILHRYDELGVYQILISGNHDKYSADQTHLLLFEQLAEAGHFDRVTIATCEPKVRTINGKVFLLIPGSLSGSSVDIVRRMLSVVDQKVILVGHEGFRGSRFDNGAEYQSGQRLTEHPKILYYAYGDFHVRQQIGNIKRAWYCGSPITTSFGSSPDKGFLLVNTKKPESPKFVRLRLPGQLLTTTSLDEAEKNPEHYYRLLYKPRKGLPEGLPPNVLKTVPTIPRSSGKTTFEASQVELPQTLNGLQEWLCKQGYPKSLAESAFRRAETYLRSLAG